MKKDNKRNLLLNLFIFLFLGLACDGSTNLSGKISDTSGKPVEGAKVTLKINDKSIDALTKSDGSYIVFDVHAPFGMKYKLTVTKEGFQTYEQIFESKEELGRKRDIILKNQ